MLVGNVTQGRSVHKQTRRISDTCMTVNTCNQASGMSKYCLKICRTLVLVQDLAGLWH